MFVQSTLSTFGFKLYSSSSGMLWSCAMSKHPSEPSTTYVAEQLFCGESIQIDAPAWSVEQVLGGLIC